MSTLLSLPASTVLPAGTTTSANFNFPQTLTNILTQFTVQPPDITDPTITMDFSLWRETSAGSGEFVFDHGFTWNGNSIDKHGQPGSPAISTDVGPLSGLACQLRITLNKPLHTAILVTGS